MRMTNKIMQNNSLYNINNNKVLQDKLSTQMSTQKKLTRPSDDPVVAIRALRLRSSVSEITQYSTKNAEDAESWLKVTADGLSTVNDILTDLSKNATKGANKDLTADDLEIIITQMESLSEEFYSTGNLDYAGRYVFTGFRTDTPMSFTASDVADTVNPIPSYSITEQINISSFDSVNYTTIGKLNGITSSNYSDASHEDNEQSVTNNDIHRLRLAYDNVVSAASGVTIQLATKAADGKVTLGAAVNVDAAASKEAAYSAIIEANEADPKTEKAVYIPETGEILMSDALYNANIGTQSNVDTNKYEFRVNYTKSAWSNGDLRPEHYFACTSTDKSVTPTKTVDYNKDYLAIGSDNKLYVDKEKQSIAYDVGYNQTIEINTTADEVFEHSLARDVDDLRSALNDLKNIESIRSTLDTALDGMDSTDAKYDQVKKEYDAADKAYTYIRENVHDLMQAAITKMQNYLDEANVAVTDNGTRSSRLELIANRLTEQKTTFETLKSENEDVDIAEVAVQLTSAQLTYEASLTATGKIMQTTLMNYI